MSYCCGAAATATEIAAAVRGRHVTASAVAEAALQRIARSNGAVNAFTTVTADRAMRDAARVDDRIAAGEDPGPLSGVPFAVKNLFDIAGVTTLAGSRILAGQPPAGRDAHAVESLTKAGAVLCGALNMEEFAYGFLTDNHHYGRTCNPHDLAHTAGGSSGGSGAAVAAGLVPITLGSDTNGSIRVPSAFCGTYGFKPTYGRLSRSGMVLFAPSFDHVGPLARSVADIAAAYDALQGPDPSDPAQAMQAAAAVSASLAQGMDGRRIAVAEGYFADCMTESARQALDAVATALAACRRVTIPGADAARAAAYVITSIEGSSGQYAALRSRPEDFDPATRDRFLAGALLPGEWYVRAQRFRTWFRQAVQALFADVDLILAPTVPFEAPSFGEEMLEVGGRPVPTRSTIGRFTQPLSLIGLPILSVPVHRPGRLPLGVQIIGRPFEEATVLRASYVLEAAGITSAPVMEPTPG